MSRVDQRCNTGCKFMDLLTELTFDYGASDQVSPLIRRVIAKNPGPFTFTGTGTYIVGQGEVAVIDPGPADTEHILALMDALEGEAVSHILITHTHLDHSPAAVALQNLTGAQTYGFGPHGAGKRAHGIEVEAGGDMDFVPDVKITGGEILAGPNWTLEALYTPGHTSNHMCFALAEEKAVFTGDHVMGWSTTVIAPPDGDMAAYLKSLMLLTDREDLVYWPTHGPCINAPVEFVSSLITHRQEREKSILKALQDGISKISDMVPVIYTDLDPRLHMAAGLSVLAHLIHLHDKNMVTSDGDPGLTTDFRID